MSLIYQKHFYLPTISPPPGQLTGTSLRRQGTQAQGTCAPCRRIIKRKQKQLRERHALPSPELRQEPGSRSHQQTKQYICLTVSKPSPKASLLHCKKNSNHHITCAFFFSLRGRADDRLERLLYFSHFPPGHMPALTITFCT